MSLTGQHSLLTLHTVHSICRMVKKSLPSPLTICGSLSTLQQAPCISSQAIILAKFRLTSTLENFSSSNPSHSCQQVRDNSNISKTFLFKSFWPGNVRSHGKKELFEVWERQKWRAWEWRSYAFPPTLTPGSPQPLVLA